MSTQPPARPSPAAQPPRRSVVHRGFSPDYSAALDQHLDERILRALLSDDTSPAAVRDLRTLLLESHAAHRGALQQRATVRAFLHQLCYHLGGVTFVHTATGDVQIVPHLAAGLSRADRLPEPDAALLHSFRHLHEKGLR